jgi:hypothetical protein
MTGEMPTWKERLMPDNPIVLENQNTGNPKSEWDIGGASSTAIAGFATKMSVNKGQQVDFKINTASSNYRIDIYRLGYYAGLGARKVQTIQRNTPSVQPAAGGDPSTGLWDAGNWSVTASWTVPSTAVSGVYVAKLVRQDGTAGASHIPFVVRDDGTARDIVFQTSDPTWHAYNGWGGANLYGGNAPAGRAYKVSYNRPYGTRDLIGTDSGPQDYIFGAEYAAIRWLERNGYDVAYVSGVDVGPGNVSLTNYKIYMSVGHDEYWSAEQRAHVEAARDAGVHLCFISGNEVYWKTRWEPDLNGVANRTMVCYKESKAGEKIDPSPVWTGTWRDPSFSPPSDGGRPENSLTGTIFGVDSHQADIIEVQPEHTRLRFWRNTSMPTLPPTATGTLPAGMLGYEYDEQPNNRFRPPGQITLSKTVRNLSDKILLDYGRTTGAGTVTHNLTLYRAPSGALVFGAGTVFWSFGLDTVHDYTSSDPSMAPVPESRDAQQATVNLFADMGVQPQTLQANLVAATASTDTTPPTTVITAPANGASVVQQSMVAITGTATDVGGLVAAVEVSTDNGVTWRAATGTTNWTFNWWPQLPGTYTIKARAIDDSVNIESPGASRTITVTPAGSVSLFTPADTPFARRTDDAQSVELGVRFTVNTPGSVTGIRFYKNPSDTGTHTGRLWSIDGTQLALATFSGESASGWQQVNFASPVPITPGTMYVASYHSNGLYSADPNYYFSTRTGGAVTAPDKSGSGANEVFLYGTTAQFPNQTYANTNYWVDVVFARAGGAGNLAPVAVPDSGFNTAVNTALQIPAAALLASDSDPNGYPLTITTVGSPVNGTVSWNAGTSTVTFTPNTGFTGAASFQYTITNGFQTATATVAVNVGVATTNQTLFAPTDTPATVNTNDNGPVELGVRFHCTVPGTIATGIKFYKGSLNIGPHTGRLWTAGGVVLATATFSGETASGWQTANFSSPVTLSPNTTYIVSYHTTTKYSVTSNYFATTKTSGALVAPAGGGNGVFSYGPAGSFPTSSFSATNYWVDVVTSVPALPSTLTLFSPDDTPAIITSSDTGPVELGVKFTNSAANSQAIGVRIYKGPQNTGPHIARLWTTAGALLASAPFTAESASGWQTVLFANPVPLTANTTYIASYNSSTRYSATGNYFANAKVNGTLSAPSSASSGGNGVFTYGPSGTFPTSSFNATNYWIDVIVRPS